MSECRLVRCQQERKLIRREFNKWTKNLLLQIGFETISKNYLEFEIDSFQQNEDEEKIPQDFNPNQTCLFCINRQEYSSKNRSHQNKTNSWLNEHTDPTGNDDENSPLDLSLKSPSNLNSRLLFDMQSDILPIYNSEEFFLSSHMNFDYLSQQTFPNLNLFSSLLPMNHHHPSNSTLPDDYVTQLAKQMAYMRMMQELESQRIHSKSKGKMNSRNTPMILAESINVNQIITDLMTRTLHEIYEEQIKQPTRVSKQGELLYVKKQANNHDDITISKINKQHKHNNQINPSSSSASSTSSVSSRCSPSIHHQKNNKPHLNSSTTTTTTTPHTSSRRTREIILNSKVSAVNDGKQIRPKRGQYRRYESEQLAKAVTAVLSNEMSVHKAGSYFGVPHSTLEYKVKERNSKTSTTKTKTELSSSTSANKTNDDITQDQSMEYDNADETDHQHEEMQLDNPLAVEMI